MTHTATVTITSYGQGHRDDPRASDPVVVNTLPLRNPPEDPRVRARMTQLTGLDPAVARYVMSTPGATELAAHGVNTVNYRLLTGETDIAVHVYCIGGRHRSVAIAEVIYQHLSAHLQDRPVRVLLTHRHIGRPVLPVGGASR